MKVIAHRGASAYAPENTLEAFALAKSMGADGIELDVQMSADGALVVIHDATVNRTSSGKGQVSRMTLGDLKALNFSYGMTGFRNIRIPMLDEVYALLQYTDMLINVEIKSEAVSAKGIWAKLLALESAYNMKGRILYSSFNHSMLPLFREHDTAARVGLLYENSMSEPWNYAKKMGADAIHPPYRDLVRTPDYVQNCKELGLDVNVWTVNRPTHMLKLCRLGVDAIITDKPDTALSMRRLTRKKRA